MQQNPKETIRAGKPRALNLTSQHAELLAEGGVLKHQVLPVFEAGDETSEEDNEEVFHGP